MSQQSFTSDVFLDHGLISSEPCAGRSHGDGCQKIACQLLKSGCDAPEMLELIEVALDKVSLAIDPPIDAALDELAARRWNVYLGAAGPDQLEQGIGIIAAVGTTDSAGRRSKLAAKPVMLGRLFRRS